MESAHKKNENFVALRTAVQVGDTQIDRGEEIPYTTDRLAAIKAKAW